MPDIRRLIAPRSVALIGAGAWTDAVAAGSAAIGFGGDRVARPPDARHRHPRRPTIATSPTCRAPRCRIPCGSEPRRAGGRRVARAARRRRVRLLHGGIFRNRYQPGLRLARELIAKAPAALPFFGPNCYGFVNFFDRVALWPDQVVGPALERGIERGVALICQSGTIALTLMFNERSLPIGYLFTVGNQSRLAVEDLIEILCDDPRVTAFGLYLEGHQGSGALRAGRGARARRGQTDRSRQIRAHGRGGAHGAQPYGRTRGRGRGVRGVLPPGRSCPLRHLEHARRDSQGLSRGRPARRPQTADHGCLGRRHGHERRCRSFARSGVRADSRCRCRRARENC